jgi:hypothetical protein
MELRTRSPSGPWRVPVSRTEVHAGGRTVVIELMWRGRLEWLVGEMGASPVVCSSRPEAQTAWERALSSRGWAIVRPGSEESAEVGR